MVPVCMDCNKPTTFGKFLWASRHKRLRDALKCRRRGPVISVVDTELPKARPSLTGLRIEDFKFTVAPDTIVDQNWAEFLIYMNLDGKSNNDYVDSLFAPMERNKEWLCAFSA